MMKYSTLVSEEKMMNTSFDRVYFSYLLDLYVFVNELYFAVNRQTKKQGCGTRTSNIKERHCDFIWCNTARLGTS